MEQLFDHILGDHPWRPTSVPPSYPSPSSDEQAKVERSVCDKFKYAAARRSIGSQGSRLLAERHASYCASGLYLTPLPSSYSSLDASRTWLVYWTSHSLNLMGKRSAVKAYAEYAIDFIARCKDQETGGYTGSPGQHPHLATSYAAVNALTSLQSEAALDSIDRPAVKRFLQAMKQPDGSFTMHKDGETDVRGAYCALSVAVLSGVYSDELFAGTADWIISCQTYEGGFSGFPGCEAHGGYSFCALAALFLLKRAEDCDLDRLLRWAVNRQQYYEGGFAGRTNKLVDGCYSFWQASVVEMLDVYWREKRGDEFDPHEWIFNQKALQMYLIFACQDPDGGMLDKPGKMADFYHTCYCLSGLSLAQNTLSDPVTLNQDDKVMDWISPYFNISLDSYHFTQEYNEKHSYPMESSRS